VFQLTRIFKNNRHLPRSTINTILFRNYFGVVFPDCISTRFAYNAIMLFLWNM